MSASTDDFIRSSGNLAYVNTWLKLISLALLLACLALACTLTVEILDSSVEKVVPIILNPTTGDAVPVDYRVVDAAGEEQGNPWGVSPGGQPRLHILQRNGLETGIPAVVEILDAGDVRQHLRIDAAVHLQVAARLHAWEKTQGDGCFPARDECKVF